MIFEYHVNCCCCEICLQHRKICVIIQALKLLDIITQLTELKMKRLTKNKWIGVACYLLINKKK